MNRTVRLGLVFVAVAIAFCFGAQNACGATDIRIDFDKNYPSPAPAGNWNHFNYQDENILRPLNDFTTGTSSGASILLNRFYGVLDSLDAWNMSNAGPSWLDPQKDAVKDYLAPRTARFLGDSSTITISGLSNSKLYDVELVASIAWETCAGLTAVYSIGSDAKTFRIYDDGFVDGKWMTWNDVSPSNGQITLTIAQPLVNSDYVGMTVNAMRIAEVPEPATLSLLALGGLAMLRRRRTPMGLAVLLLIGWPLSFLQAATPSIQILGKPDVLSAAAANAISDDGTVVTANSYDGSDHGAIWESGAGWIVPYSNGQPWQAKFTSLSGDGTTAVGYDRQGGFRWAPSGGIEYLPRLTPLNEVIPWAVSGDGSVVVGRARDASSVQRAYRWSAPDGAAALKAGVANETTTEGVTVTADGRTVFGDGWVYNSTPVAFQWTAQTGSTLLPLGRISATNTTGTMIAGFDDVGWPNYYRPYVWSQAQGKQFLPTTGAYNQFVTSAISDTGVIVGSCSDPNAPSGVPFVYAWLWSRDRGTMLVADYVRDVLGLDTTGIYFVNAADITPDGHHILCTIWRPSVGQYSETAIITIPEPATLSLLALAGLAMLKRRSGR